MIGEMVQSAGGFEVGEVIRIACRAENARVVKVQHSYAFLEWPWRRIDVDAQRAKWDGTSAFPRDPDHHEWRNTAWRVEPDVQDLRVGDLAIVGLPTVHVRIMGIRRFDPPFEMGWLPHTELALGVCFLGDEDDPEAGFSLYLPAAEPIAIEHVGDGR